MDEQQAASQPPLTKPAQEGLRRNSLNLPRLAFIGLAYFSLAPVIYLNMGFMETDSGGPVMPFLFIAITIAVLPTAISFAVLNNRRPSARQRLHLAMGVNLPGGRAPGTRQSRSCGLK